MLHSPSFFLNILIWIGKISYQDLIFISVPGILVLVHRNELVFRFHSLRISCRFSQYMPCWKQKSAVKNSKIFIILNSNILYLIVRRAVRRENWFLGHIWMKIVHPQKFAPGSEQFSQNRFRRFDDPDSYRKVNVFKWCTKV